MAWVEPIYDRVLADTTTPTSKGVFNVADWIRIYGNTEHVGALLNALRKVNIVLTTLTEPAITTIPSIDDINSFVANIEALRVASGASVISGVMVLKIDYIAGAGAKSPDYEDVNDWERDLALIKEFLYNSATYTVFSGVAETGQIRFWQNRFRNPFIPSVANPVRRARLGVAIIGTGAMRQNKFRRYL